MGSKLLATLAILTLVVTVLTLTLTQTLSVPTQPNVELSADKKTLEAIQQTINNTQRNVQRLQSERSQINQRIREMSPVTGGITGTTTQINNDRSKALRDRVALLDSERRQQLSDLQQNRAKASLLSDYGVSIVAPKEMWLDNTAIMRVRVHRGADGFKAAEGRSVVEDTVEQLSDDLEVTVTGGKFEVTPTSNARQSLPETASAADWVFEVTAKDTGIQALVVSITQYLEDDVPPTARTHAWEVEVKVRPLHEVVVGLVRESPGWIVAGTGGLIAALFAVGAAWIRKRGGIPDKKD